MKNSFLTILDILQNRAEKQPESISYIFLQDGNRETARLTYSQLNKQALSIAAYLRTVVSVGERVLLVYSSGLEFIVAFFGCLYAGVLAVPVCLPRRHQKLSRLLSIVNDAQATLLLTTTSIISDIEKKCQEETKLSQLKLVATNSIKNNFREFVPERFTSGSLAFLQYTSGSTGKPKGVMVSHGNIIHNMQLICKAFGHTKKSISVGWLPLFHDMGLIGHVLQPVYVGFPSILMPPTAFIQRPIHWLKAISKYKATISGGPNFAYDFCTTKVSSEQIENLDLSSWDLAYIGSEPIRAETMKQFSQKFASCGFKDNSYYPCYGMAETTLFATGGVKSQKPVIKRIKYKELEQNSVLESETLAESRILIGCGRPYMETKVIIVNPESLTLCEPNQVGEIWVSGNSIACGYWNRSLETKKTFQAYLKDNKEKLFLRTGDLGFLLNGELFMTGRLKDLIIIDGRNHYPQDIELTVENAHPALRPNYGAAFSVEVDGKEKLVVIQELERTYLRRLNSDELVKAINQAVFLEHELTTDAIVLLKPGSIAKTSSGKIQRHICRQKFLDGSLPNVVFSKSIFLSKT